MTLVTYQNLVSGATSPERTDDGPRTMRVGQNLARCRKKGKRRVLQAFSLTALLMTSTNLLISPVAAQDTCQTGYYVQAAGTQSACVICPEGSACPDGNSGTVNACSGTQYAPMGSTACLNVDSANGWIRATSGSVTQCGAGKKSNGSSCSNCNGGQEVCATPGVSTTCAAAEVVWTNAVRTLCSACTPGKQCSNSNESACAAGSSRVDPSTTCTTAAAGKIAPTTAMAIVDCPAGTFSTSSSSECTLCTAGKQCSNPASQSNCAANTHSGPGATQCEAILTGYYQTSTTKSNMDMRVCGDGEYVASATDTSCTQCPLNKGCETGSAVTCGATEYSLLGENSCHQVPYGFEKNGDGSITECPMGKSYDATTSSCVNCPANTACSPFLPAGQNVQCQETQFVHDSGLPTQECRVCDRNQRICPDTNTEVNTNTQDGVANFDSDGLAPYDATGGGQAEVVPYAACYTYTTDGRNDRKQLCDDDQYAVHGRPTKQCTTAAFLYACDIASPTSCPKGTWKRANNYFYCEVAHVDTESNGGATDTSENCDAPQFAWYGQETCRPCTTDVNVANTIGQKDIGNACKAHFELNDIPCRPGTAVRNNNNDWNCSSENGRLFDGAEAAFGTDRNCHSMPQLQTGNTFLTGAMQSLIHTTDWKGDTTIYNGGDTSAELDEFQCQDCPEMQACNPIWTTRFNVWCWGQELPISCYKGIGTIPAGKPGAGNDCPKNLRLDDRRIQRNDHQFCQDANAKYHRNRMITFAAHYFLDNDNDATQYLDCPFQTEVRTVSRHIHWKDSDDQWSITDGRMEQVGVDGELERPMGSDPADFPAATKEGETPTRRWTNYDRKTHNPDVDYESKVWFMDEADEDYNYPYCKIDSNYFDYTVIEGHRKPSWEDEYYTVGTDRASHLCPLYQFLSPNYPTCMPNDPGFISVTDSDTRTEIAIGEPRVGQRSQYFSKLENKGDYTSIMVSDCPQFMWHINGFFGGSSAENACRIGEQSECITDTADFCHSGQDFMCPQGMVNSSANKNNINDCDACVAGQFCGTGASGGCPSGYNCPAYTVDMTMLPAQPGQKADTTTTFAQCEYEYCPGKNQEPDVKYCPDGFYNNFPSFFTGHFTAASCSPNPSGQYTLAASSTVTDATPNYQACDAGSYCMEGTHTGVQCPTGTFRTATGAQSLNDCTTCTAGSYCALGSTAAGNCAAGTYCPAHAFFEYEFNCPVGKTSASGGGQSTEAACSTNCAAGDYCREGEVADPALCDAAGYVCPSGAMRTTCAPGSSTTTGSSAADASSCTPCVPGSFCVGAGPSELCPMGTFQDQPGQADCKKIAGQYTNAPGATAGTATVAGEQSLPTGDTQATKCEYGYVCAPTKTECSQGNYCPLASGTETDLAAGYVQDETGLWFEKPCEPGTYCVDGAGSAAAQVSVGYYTHAAAGADSTTACADGYNCPAGSIGSNSEPCPVNEWFLNSNVVCPSSSTTECCTPELCLAGQYCIHAMEPTCPQGFVCPNPRTDYSSEFIPDLLFDACPVSTYRATTGGSLPWEVANCDPLNSAGCSTDTCTLCDGGYGCIEPGSAAVYKECGAGYYCNIGSPSTTPLIYCQTIAGGVATPSYDPVTFKCTYDTDTDALPAAEYMYGVCPVGYFCEKGTIEPQVCPAGTFSKAYAARSADSCIDCLEGYYCDGGVAITECAAGTFCPAKSAAETPVSVAGEWSLGRYPAAIKCQPGTFLAAGGTQSVCTITSQGFYQPVFGADAEIPCLAGHDCSVVPVDPDSDLIKGWNGIIYPRQCNYGYYALAVTGACTLCEQHSYCQKNAAVVADLLTFKCPNGYECELGANHQFMNYDINGADTAQAATTGLTGVVKNYLCPRGHYCDATAAVVGTLVQTKCAIGTYTRSIGTTLATECTACPYGYVCNFNDALYPNSNEIPDDCPTGKWCAQNTDKTVVNPIDCQPGEFCSAKAGALYKCAWGTYQDQANQLSCMQCPAQKKCPDEGLPAEQACDAFHYCDQNADGLGAAIPQLCAEGSNVPTGSTALLASCTEVDQNTWYRSPNNDQAGNPLFGEIANGYKWEKTGAKDVVPSTSTVCDSGFFCWKGDRTACAAGTWCNNRKREVDGETCPAGYYCTQNTNPETSILTGTNFKAMIKQFCPQGYACPAGTNTGTPCAVFAAGCPVPCPCGTYSSAFGLVDVSECHTCPEGYICDQEAMTWADVDTTAKYCPQGFYCGAGTGAGTCDDSAKVECHLGTYCPANVQEVIACDGGTFTNAVQQTVCQNCAAKKYCPWTPTVVTAPGASQETQCPPGHKCSVANLSQPEPCSPGQYQPDPDQEVCLACPESFYCPQYGMDAPIACPDTYECPASSTQPTLCQDGTYCSTTDITTQSGGQGYVDPRDPTNATIMASNTCPTGYFCIKGRRYSCYAGYVCSVNSITPTPSDGQGGSICPKGYYCEPSSTSPLVGTLYGTEQACPIGTYNPSFGAESITDCINCAAGYQCDTPGATFQIPIACPAGYLCLSDGTQSICLEGFSCPTGAVEMIPCEDGTYQDEQGQTTCKKCPAGGYCQKWDNAGTITGSIASIICPKGFYCPESTPNEFSFPCPPGTYGDAEGYKTQFQILDAVDPSIVSYAGCIPCLPKFYCPDMGMGSVPIVWTDYPCKDGYICNGGNNKKIGDELCPPDNYCLAGNQVPCPPGQFVTIQGAASADECIDCPPGKVCPTASNNMMDCPQGYYCDAGGYYDITPGNAGGTFPQCTAGHYCPTGSFQQKKCQPGTYQDVPGSFECKECPVGNYCLQSGMAAPTLCDGAFLNWFCPAGSIYPKLCEIGQWYNIATTACEPCPFGKYCWPDPTTQTATFGITGDCDFAGGYLCRGGSYSPRPQQKNLNLILAGSSLFSSYNGPVIRGYISDGAGGTSACQPGTFQPSPFTFACLDCMKGRFCPDVGMYDLIEYRCKGGYECLEGQTEQAPAASVCPVGYQCPSRVPTKLVCEDGFYSTKTGLVVCEPCPPGFHCENDIDNVLATKKPCIEGSVCLGGVPRQPNCPDGYLLSGNQCRNCTASNYCRAGQEAGICAAGYVCNGTFANPDPNPSGYECPKGQYCGYGSIYSRPCPFETMSIADKQRQSTDCRGCQPGYVCKWGERQWYPCPPGSWCPPAGPSKIYKQYEYLCPTGTYNPEKLKVYLDDCLQCDEGYYCEYEGMVHTGKVCPKGHFCPLGSDKPRACRAGTFIDFEGAVFEDDCLDCPIGYWCPEANRDPIQCDPGQMCLGNTAIPQLCPGGYFCNNETQFMPEPCQPNYYCPLGTGVMTKCDVQYVCDWTTEMQMLCGPGYYVKDFNIPGVPNQCLPCPKGTFSNMDIPGCRPCTAGFVCYGRTNTPYPMIFNQNNGEICPRGHYCPIGTWSAYPCPPGTYNPVENQESDLKCRVCPVNTYNDKWGQEGCKPCGQFATSREEAVICSCIGEGRLYSLADASCRCQSGYDFKASDGVSLADQSSTQDCFPIVLDRCQNYGNGTDYVRTPSGDCKRYDDCSDSCGGEPGLRSSVTGICTCSNEQNIDFICNQDCRKKAPTVEYINTYQVKLTYADGTEKIVSLNDVGDAYGQIVCPFPPCETVQVEIGKEGFVGIYAPSQLMQNTINQGSQRRERMLISKQLGGTSYGQQGNYTHTIRVRNVSDFSNITDEFETSSYERRRLQQISETGIKNPSYCIKEDITFTFSIPSPYNYPTYMRDSVLNSNPNFDYGQFLVLEQNMKRKQAKGDISPSVFSFTFTEKGSYVFQNSNDANDLLIVSVKAAGEECSDSERYIQTASAQNIAEQGVRVKDKIIQKPNYLLFGFLITILVTCTAIALVMIGYCLRKQWNINELSMKKECYREMQLQLSINHENQEFFTDNNDFINHKSDLIADEEDDLDNFNLDIQQDIMDAGKRYLKYYGRKKQKCKKFKHSRRDRLNQLIRIINEDVTQLQVTAEEKKMRYLDMDKIHLLDDGQMKQEIQKELEAQNEQERVEAENYARRKEEMMADASERDVNKYNDMINAMKDHVRQYNKELNSQSVSDLNEEDIKLRKELAIYDNGDINSKANKFVFDIQNDKNLSDEEKESLLRAHDEAMLELKIAMDADMKKQNKEMDKALQEKLVRRRRLREEQCKKQIKDAQKKAEDSVNREIERERSDRFEDIIAEFEGKVADLKDLPTDLLKARTKLYEADADDQRRAVDKELEEKKRHLVDERKKQATQKFLEGAGTDAELRKMITEMLSNFNSNANGQNIIDMADNQKRQQEDALKDKLKMRKDMMDRARAREGAKIEQDLEECDIFGVTELEKRRDEDYLKKKLKDALVKRFSKQSPQTSPRLNGSDNEDQEGETTMRDELPADDAEQARKMAAKQRMFDITNNLDTAMQQKSLMQELQRTHGEFADELIQQRLVDNQKLAQKRELLKARRKNKQLGNLEDQKLKDKLDLLEFDQVEKKKLNEDYIRSLFKLDAHGQIETPEQKNKRLELLNEYLSDQSLERLSGLLMKQFLEKDQTLKNLMQKYLDLQVNEVSAIKANFNIDNEALDKVEGFDPVQLAQTKRTLEFNEKALINEVDLRIKNAHKEEEASLLKVMESKHAQEQIKLREQISEEHTKMRQQLIGESEVLKKEEQFEAHAVQKYEKLKNEENKRRLEKIELEKKKLNAEFEAELNEKYKDYDDMIAKRGDKKAELEQEAMTIKDRIEKNKSLIKAKAGQFDGIDRNEIMMDLQRNTDAIDSIITLEHREQFFKMKQKLELRKKQVRRAKAAKEEADKNVSANAIGGKFGKFLLKRAGTLNLDDMEDDDSVLYQRLKAWKQRKAQYLRQKAEGMDVDMEKDQVQMMIVKLMTIESQLKQMNAERNRKNKDKDLNSSHHGSRKGSALNHSTAESARPGSAISRQSSYSSLPGQQKKNSRTGGYNDILNVRR